MLEMEEKLTNKELLLRITKNYGKKRKIKRVQEPKLTVEGLDSPLVEANFSEITYRNTPSIPVRKAITNIIKSYE